MTTIKYLTVDEWGGVWVRPPASESLPDGEVYLHHVGGGAWMGGTVAAGEAASRRAAIAVFQNLNIYATRPKSEGGKGYSFLDYDALGWYDRFNDIGWIAEGRGRHRSAATLDRNEQGEAFCMCGNYSLRSPLPAELELAAHGIVYMADQGWTTRDAIILGHRDNPAHPDATGCPGDFLYAQLPQIRRRVDELLAPPTPEPDREAHMLVIRARGAADQWLCIPIDSPSAKRKMVPNETLPPLVVDVDLDEVAARIPYDLTPHKETP